ncbi:tail protein [Psychrobacillus phage Perkons]|nr:tail protein [Psychrobacillus phage Perkons]
MRLGEIDRNLKVLNPNLFLCKPDKKTIGKLKEAHDISYSTKLGTINEISFKIPVVVEKDRVPITNPNVEKIKHRYLFKLTLGHSVEYFLFTQDNKNVSDSDEFVEYRAYSLGIQLADKMLRRWDAVSKSLTQMLTEVLAFTNWKIGYVDSDFELVNDPALRSHEVSSQTVLQVVYDLAAKFNAIILWDTEKLEINLFKPENVGLNKGLRIKEGKYLDSLNLSTNSEETITRLILIGADDLSIRRLSPTGSNYIEDFSWYIYPFERDENRNVITHSDRMSDELCHSLLDYNEYLNSIDGVFELYTGQLTVIQKTLEDEYQIFDTLKNDLRLILDELDVSNANFQMTSDGNEIPVINTPEHQAIIARRVAKESEIDIKIAHIANIVDLETVKRMQINNLVNASKIDFHLGSLMMELNDFIVEKEYINDIIIDDEDLLKEGIEAFNQFREPKIKLELDIINFLSIVECQNDWDKLVLGDEILVKHDRFGLYIKAKIIEIEYDFESDNIKLTIANEKEIRDDNSWIDELIYNAGNTSTVVNMDKYKWDLAEENNGTINAIINNKWDALKNAVLAGYEQKVEISERGIIVRSLDDPLSWLVIQNGMLSLTGDGGNSWKVGITPDGVIGEKMYCKKIGGMMNACI